MASEFVESLELLLLECAWKCILLLDVGDTSEYGDCDEMSCCCCGVNEGIWEPNFKDGLDPDLL